MCGDGPEPTMKQRAADARYEPKMTDAAQGMNVRYVGEPIAKRLAVPD